MGALPLLGGQLCGWQRPELLRPSSHYGNVGGKERTSKSPPGNHLPPLLFLAPFSWSRRVSVVMQIRRCWPTPILSPLPASPLPPPMPTLTQPTGTSARHAWCPCPWLNWHRGWVELWVLRGFCLCHKDRAASRYQSHPHLPVPAPSSPGLGQASLGHYHLYRQSMPPTKGISGAATDSLRCSSAAHRLAHWCILTSTLPALKVWLDLKGTWAIQGHSLESLEFLWNQYREIGRRAGTGAGHWRIYHGSPTGAGSCPQTPCPPSSPLGPSWFSTLHTCG